MVRIENKFRKYIVMSLRTKIYRYVYEQHWTIGFIEQPITEVLEGMRLIVHYVKNMPRECWFADPFILDCNDKEILVLAEEFNYDIRRGRIAKLTIDRNTYRLLNYNIVLDLPTHLSFPFVWREKEKVYICPENSASGGWNMYEYDRETDAITFVRKLSDKPLTDAVLTNVNSKNVVISTNIPMQNGNRLTVYNEKDEIIKEIVLDSNVARNAGDWFRVGNKCYRPAQDCNGAYGKAVIIQEINNIDSTFDLKDIRRIESTNRKFTTGCHTFNMYRDIIVVDVHGWRHNFAARLVKHIKRIL